MGSRLAVIHCEPRIPWQPKRAAYFREGLRRYGVSVEVTDSRKRIRGSVPILLGTTCWRDIERDGGDFLLVDRCSFGDTEKFVSLVWNGHGRRGDHRVPIGEPDWRWKKHGVELGAWQKSNGHVVLCGQTETYSPRYTNLSQWYSEVPATHFRRHPAGSNPTGLFDARGFDGAIAVTLNSSIGVQCVLNGIPTVTMDEGSMAWDVTGHSLDDIRTPERERWCRWLAWTQWSDDEIRMGEPWDYLW